MSQARQILELSLFLEIAPIFPPASIPLVHSFRRKVRALRYDAIRPVLKPIFGMLHLTGADADERLAIAAREIEVLVENGIDGLVVENYFGDADDVRRVLDLLSE